MPSEYSLYIVATPIGNLGDVTERALQTLRDVAVIYAEDTRVTRTLLNRYGITTVLHSYREAQSRSALEKTIAELLATLEVGDVAYVTDAGTPGVSDPGDYLVRRVREAGGSVVPVPGASALATLLSVAGLGVQHPLFEGFLPHKKGRQTRLAQLEQALAGEVCDGVVLYEAPTRILKLLEEMNQWKREPMLVLGRELTKQYEELLVGTPSELIATLTSRPAIKGEIVLLVTHHV